MCLKLSKFLNPLPENIVCWQYTILLWSCPLSDVFVQRGDNSHLFQMLATTFTILHLDIYLWILVNLFQIIQTVFFSICTSKQLHFFPNLLFYCSWVLLLARFSKALPRLCPDLERSVTLHSVSQASADQSVRRSMLMSRSLSSKQAHVDPLWTQSVELLNSTASNCYR